MGMQKFHALNIEAPMRLYCNRKAKNGTKHSEFLLNLNVSKGKIIEQGNFLSSFWVGKQTIF